MVVVDNDSYSSTSRGLSSINNPSSSGDRSANHQIPSSPPRRGGYVNKNIGGSSVNSNMNYYHYGGYGGGYGGGTYTSTTTTTMTSTTTTTTTTTSTTTTTTTKNLVQFGLIIKNLNFCNETSREEFDSILRYRSGIVLLPD